SSSTFVAVAEADDASGRIQSRPHFQFPELRFPSIQPPQVRAEGYRQALLLRPLVDLPPLRYGPLGIADDRLEKGGFARSFYVLDERYECRVEVDTVVGHHRHRLLAHKLACSMERTPPEGTAGPLRPCRRAP